MIIKHLSEISMSRRWIIDLFIILYLMLCKCRYQRVTKYRLLLLSNNNTPRQSTEQLENTTSRSVAYLACSIYCEIPRQVAQTKGEIRCCPDSLDDWIAHITRLVVVVFSHVVSR